MEFLKKNKILAIVIAVILLIGVGAAVMAMGRGGEDASNTPASEDEVRKLSPEEIGLTLETVSENEIMMTISKLDGIRTIEYETSYDREFEDEETGEVGVRPDGSYGEPIDVTGETEIEKELYLGTCSATCTPHKVKSDVKFIIKVTFESGEIGAVETSHPNPQGEEAEE